MDMSNLTLSQKIMLPTGALLVIVLLVAPWHNIDLGFISESRQAIQSPNALWGVLALLLTLAVLVVGVMRAFGLGSLPETLNGQSWERIMFITAAVVFAFLVLKLVVETDFLGWGAYVAIILAAGQAYGAFEGQK